MSAPSQTRWWSPYGVWAAHWQFKDISIRGHAISASESGFRVSVGKEAVFFDAGIRCDKLPRVVCISHTHSDHISALPQILQHHDDKPVPAPVIICPPGQDASNIMAFLVAERVAAHSKSARGISMHPYQWNMLASEPRSHDNWALVWGLGPGRSVHLTQRMQICVLKTDHTVPSQGYVFIECRKKVCSRFLNWTPEQFKTRKSEVEYYDVWRSRVCYTGDTRASIWTKDYDWMRVWQYCDVIITECTFIGDDVSPEVAEERGHTHWYQLKPLVEDLARTRPEARVVLVHWSSRYTPDTVRATFKDHPNVVPWGICSDGTGLHNVVD